MATPKTDHILTTTKLLSFLIQLRNDRIKLLCLSTPICINNSLLTII